MSKVTIKELARITGWSVATISRALNDKDGISVSKKEKIKKLAKKLGYHPNQNARSIKLGKSKTIGVIVSSLSDVFSTDVMSGIEAAANERNFKMLFVGVDEDFQREREAIDNYLESQVDGLIIAPCMTPFDYTKLLQGTPTVFIDRDPSDATVKFNSVCLDNVNSAETLVTDLINKGARRIGLLNTVVSYSASLRERGYRQALKMAGIKFDPGTVVYSWNNKKNVEQMTRQLVVNQHCDASFLADNSIFIPALRKCQEYDYQKMVFGVIDDCNWYDLLKFPVSSIKQPSYEIGIESLRLLAKLIEGKIKSPSSIRLGGTLISRK